MSFGQATKGAERRQFGRRDTSLHAWIRVPGRPPQACLVRNVSVGGALLQCTQPRALPFTFLLVIETTGDHILCEARHCTETTIGVMFRKHEKQDEKAQGPSRVAITELDQWAGITPGPREA